MNDIFSYFLHLCFSLRFNFSYIEVAKEEEMVEMEEDTKYAEVTGTVKETEYTHDDLLTPGTGNSNGKPG